MPTILVDDAQAKLISESAVVEVRDGSGRLLGVITSDLLKDIETARERMQRPRRGVTLDEAWERITASGDAQ